MATASEKGTLVRLWDTKTGTQIRELRRGADRADIYSLAFSANAEWLCVSSHKGTVHIYGLTAEHDKREEENRRNKAQEDSKTRVSTFSFMKEILPSYFSSEWSFASFHIPESYSICCFGSQPDSNHVIGIFPFFLYLFYLYSFSIFILSLFYLYSIFTLFYLYFIIPIFDLYSIFILYINNIGYI